MSRDRHSYEPAKGHGLAHDPFNAIVGPRPIGWISSRDSTGGFNLAPYSFFNAFCYSPPIIGFSSTNRKDSIRNIQATGDFCWNLVTLPLAQAMNASSAMVPPEIDEFELAALTPLASTMIGAPRVAESPVTFECKLTQILRLTSKDGRDTESWMTFGEVVVVHIDKALLQDGVYQTALAEPILRGGGAGDYFKIGPEQKFVMKRPG